MNFDCSVVITGKNCANYISEALGSLSEQVGLDSLELIYVDDGSIDGSLTIVKSYAYPNFIELKYFSCNVGRAKALDYGVKKSSSDYICILDADDKFHPNKISKQLEIMKESNYDVLGTSYTSDDNNSSFNGGIITSDYSIRKIELNDIIRGNPICHSSVIMKRNVVSYDITRKRQIDLKLWLDLASDKRSIGIISIPLTYKRLHENQSFEAKGRLAYSLSSFLLTVSYAKPFFYFLPDLSYRTCKLIFHLLPRKLTSKIKKIRSVGSFYRNT